MTLRPVHNRNLLLCFLKKERRNLILYKITKRCFYLLNIMPRLWIGRRAI